ncbi:hypothetical protein Q3G72_021171 [Acer saccharum]|nr:hypothetical protein Q3G72_021171 [Acer saccharum]
MDGTQIFLSAIKEWMVEFGSSMISTSFRPDMSEYRLGKPSKQYAPWYEPVLKTVRLAVAIIALLKDQTRASRLSFTDVIKRVSEFNQNHPAYISSNPSTVERHVVVHGQIILNKFSEFSDKTIRKCAVVTEVRKLFLLTLLMREVFLSFHCLEFELGDVKEIVVVQIQSIPWGHQHRKANAYKDKAVREETEDRKIKGLSTMYFCKSLYWPERGAFFRLPTETIRLGSGVCHSCKIQENKREKETLKFYLCRNGFTSKGTEYCVHDFVYLLPNHFAGKDRDQETFRGGRDVGLKAYAVCQLLEIEVPKEQGSANSTKVKEHRFFRSEDISEEKAYYSGI